MKVVLEAFGGALRSEIIDWPEKTQDNIRLILDIDSSHYFNFYGDCVVPNRTTSRVATFIWNGKYTLLGDKTGKTYVLVDVGEY